MFWQRCSRLFCSVIILTIAATAYGQGGAVGSIVGNLVDQNGFPLSGVKVSAVSDTQIGGERVGYTNSEGFFRFPGLQPGTFTVVAKAPKLKMVRQGGVKVGITAPAEVNLVMEVETGTEEVTVVERAPIVSTTSANVKEVYDEEFIDNLPLETRTAVEEFVGNNVPGVAPVGVRSARIRGGNVEQNAFMVDGFFMNNAKTTYKSLSAMEVQTAGYGADGATTAGGLVTMVTKSGSNRLELDVNGFHEDSLFRMFGDSTDDQARYLRTYINPNLSGPIIKDKLWYYVNFEARSEIQGRETDPSGFFADPPTSIYGNVRGTAKVTWQLAQRHKLQSFSLFNRNIYRNQINGLNVEADAQSMRDDLDYFSGLTWEALLGDSAFFRTQVGLTSFRQEVAPQLCQLEPVTCDHLPSVIQSFPQTIRQGNHTVHNQSRTRSLEFVNTLEWFLHGRRWGEHNLKAVSRYYNGWQDVADSTPGDRTININGQIPDRETVFFSNDPRLEPERFGYRIASSSGYRWVNSLADSIRFGRTLTVNPGLALTATGSSNSQGETVTGGLGLTPHLSAAWDATQDGRTVVRASFNNYLDADTGRLARFSLGNRVSRECRWDETTQSFSRECRYAGGASGRTVGLPCGPQGIDQNGQPCREKLKIPRTWEYTLGAEREIVPGVGLGADLVHREYTNPYSTKETNRVWNPSGSALMRTGAFRTGQPETIEDLETPAEARRTYSAVTGTVHKREGTLKVSFSYTWSRLYGNVNNAENNEWGNIPERNLFLVGYLPDDARHNIKTTLTYQWTKWLTSGVAYRYYSGRPYSRRLFNSETNGYDNYRSRVGIDPGLNLNDPNDDRELRLPDLQQFNLQLRANLQPLLRQNVEVFADILNLMALRTTTQVVEEDGPRFGQIQNRSAPLNVRLGFRYKY